MLAHKGDHIQAVLYMHAHVCCCHFLFPNALGQNVGCSLEAYVLCPQSRGKPFTGDHRQARRAELQSRAELHQARMDALHARSRQPGSAAAAPKKAAPLGFSPTTQNAIANLTAAQNATASSSEAIHARADTALSAAAAASAAAGIIGHELPAAVDGKQSAVEAHTATRSAAHTPASLAAAAKLKGPVETSQAATDRTSKAVDRQESRRDKAAAPQPSSGRQASKRRRSSSSPPSPVRGADIRTSKGSSIAVRHADGASQRRRTR